MQRAGHRAVGVVAPNLISGLDREGCPQLPQANDTEAPDEAGHSGNGVAARLFVCVGGKRLVYLMPLAREGSNDRGSRRRPRPGQKGHEPWRRRGHHDFLSQAPVPPGGEPQVSNVSFVPAPLRTSDLTL